MLYALLCLLVFIVCLCLAPRFTMAAAVLAAAVFGFFLMVGLSEDTGSSVTTISASSPVYKSSRRWQDMPVLMVDGSTCDPLKQTCDEAKMQHWENGRRVR